jgi:hypothetical protein
MLDGVGMSAGFGSAGAGAGVTVGSTEVTQ